MKNKSWILIAVFLLLQIYVLFLPPVAGVQNDRMYETLVQNGMYQTENAANFNLTYQIQDQGVNAKTTVPISLVKHLAQASGQFPVQLMAAIYMVLFAAGIYFAFSKLEFSVPWLSWVLMGATLIVFGDTGYTAYFNSITYEGAAFAYFVLLLGITIRIALTEKPQVWEIIVLAISAFLFCGTTKHLYLLAPLCALLLVRFGWARKEMWWRAVSIGSAVAVLLANTGLFIVQTIPDGAYNRYNAVFYGALAEADETEAVRGAEWFHLPEEAALLAGTSYYEDPSWTDEQKDTMVADVSYGSIALYYLSHPGALWAGIKSSTNNAFFVRQDHLSYFQWNEQTKIVPFVWNTVKRMLPIQNFLFLFVLWAAMLAGCIYYRKKTEKKRLCDMGIWLLLMSAVMFFLPMLFFGRAQLSKTMFPFGMMCDAIILILIGWGVEIILRRQKNLKEKYGVRQ